MVLTLLKSAGGAATACVFFRYENHEKGGSCPRGGVRVMPWISQNPAGNTEGEEAW